MKPRALTAVFVATAIAIVVILVLWVYPGYLATSTNCPSHATVAGRAYCAETVTLVQSTPCTGGSFCPACPSSVASINGAVFQLVFYNESSGPIVKGCAVESNSTLYQFALSADPLSAVPVQWISGDHELVVLWQPPFTTTGTGGLTHANVTCGVALATTAGA